LQVFDVKNPDLRAALEAAPKITESLCPECRAHFDGLRARLEELEVAYVVDPTLVRGLDYYTRTAFEFIGPEENVNSTICGGGRYDGLVEAVGGPPTPGVGFGAGIERLELAVEREHEPVEAPRLDVFFAVEEGVSASSWLRAVRREGLSADTDFAGRSLRGQITQGQKLARRVVVLSAEGAATLRTPGRQDRPIDEEGLLRELRS
jgi:histidyl-tRNA synthetase